MSSNQSPLRVYLYKANGSAIHFRKVALPSYLESRSLIQLSAVRPSLDTLSPYLSLTQSYVHPAFRNICLFIALPHNTVNFVMHSQYCGGFRRCRLTAQRVFAEGACASIYAALNTPTESELLLREVCYSSPHSALPMLQCHWAISPILRQPPGPVLQHLRQV